MAEGLFLDFTETEVVSILNKAKTLVTEGKTMMSYGVGGRNAAKQFTLPIAKVLRECRFALKRKNPDTYGFVSTRTVAKFR